MRAIVIQQYGGPEQLRIQEIPDPERKPGHVIIEVKAFGINHAEIYFRKGLWGDVAKVSGIECVGIVKADPTGVFQVGQRSRPSWEEWVEPSTEAMRNSRRCRYPTLRRSNPR